MLAPLKNRAILEKEPADAPADGSDLDDAERLKRAQLEAEISSLRQALRESRAALRRSATQSAQKLIAQANEISHLKALNAYTAKRLADLESGHAIIELGRKLIELSEANHSLCGAAQRVWCLEKTIRAAHGEYQRLSSERDALALQMHDQPHTRQQQS